VRAAGTDTVALDIGPVPVEAGKVYSAFALGLADGTPALTVKLTVDATAAAATATPAPATNAGSATPAAVPAGGGAPSSEDGGVPAWMIALVAVVLLGAGTASVAAVRARSDR
jgi:hypothetical protein